MTDLMIRDDVGQVAEVRLAPGTRLLGPYQSSGFRDERFLIRRPDGQMVLVSKLIYFVAERLDGTRTVEDIAVEASRCFERHLDESNILYLIDARLRQCGLIADPSTTATTAAAPTKTDPLLGLSVRFVMLSPRVVRTLARGLAVLFRPGVVFGALLTLFVFDYWLVVERLGHASFGSSLVDPKGILLLMAVVLGSMVFHELGHASACSYGGAHPGAVGAGLYLIFPAFYTNVTDAYRLDRTGRLRTDLGGIYFNAVSVLIIAPFVVVTGSPVLVAGVVVIHIQALQQLVPVVRFDGYYILSDLVGIPDLFTRIRPIVSDALHPRRPRSSHDDLRPGVRAVVLTWMAIVIPLLVFSTFFLIWRLPHMVTTSVEALQTDWGTTRTAIGARDVLTTVSTVIGMIFVALPIIALALLAGRVVNRAALSVVGARSQDLPSAAPQVQASYAGTPPGGEPPIDLTASSFTEEAMVRLAGRSARRGWRRAVRNASGGRINLGPGRAELEHDRLVEVVNSPLVEARRIAVVCRKGGCGKTTTSLMLGHTFAVHRRDRVVALDANPDAGSLGQRVRQRSEKTITDLLADRQLLTRYADIQRYASKTPTGLDIVGSDNDPRISQRLGEADYRNAIDVLDRFYNIIVPDTGTGIMDPAVQGVLAEADQLVLVIPPALDGARVAASTLDWLDNHGYAHLVRSSVGVISAVRGPSALELDLVEEHFVGRCAAVVKIPWDPALSVGGSATLDDLLPATRSAYLDLAVAVASQFGTESGRGARS